VIIDNLQTFSSRPGLLNSFSSVDHHAFSDNSVHPSR